MQLTTLAQKLFLSVALGTNIFAIGCSTYKTCDTNSFYEPPQQKVKRKKQKLTFENMTWQEVIQAVETPSQAEKYCSWLKDNRKKDDEYHYYSFKSVHEGARIDCNEVAYSAAALLGDNGYPPIVMCLSDFLNSEGHMVFVYKQHGKYGSIGIQQNDCQEPVYDSIETLAQTLQFYGPVQLAFSWTGQFIFDQKTYGRYALVNLAENDPDYITTERDMRKSLWFWQCKRIPSKD